MELKKEMIGVYVDDDDKSAIDNAVRIIKLKRVKEIKDKKRKFKEFSRSQFVKDAAVKEAARIIKQEEKKK